MILFAVLGLAVLVLVVIVKTAVVVPQQQAFVVERLGKYHSTLSAGFHVLLPFATSTPSRRRRSTSPSRFASPATTSRSPWTASST